MTAVSRATDSTNVASNFADNTAGDISASDMRSQLTNIRESLPLWFDDVATTLTAAATTSLGTTSTRFINITGSTAITSFGSTSNSFAFVKFDSTPTLTHNSTLINLPTSTNIVAQAGDAMFAVSDSVGVWKVQHYSRASHIPLNVPLAAIGGITPAASTFPYYPTSTTASAAVITPFALSLLDDLNSASARATIGVGLGTGDLVAANNLSDVADSASARTNLGVLAIASNLSDVNNSASARANIGAFKAVSVASVTCTNQTTIEFASIPASTHKIEMFLNGVSTNGSSIPLIQVSSSGGYLNAGYTGAVTQVTNAAATVGVNHGASFTLAPTTVSTTRFDGTIVLDLFEGTTWTMTGILGMRAATATIQNAGAITVGNTLTAIRLIATNATDQFDSGTVAVRYYQP